MRVLKEMIGAHKKKRREEPGEEGIKIDGRLSDTREQKVGALQSIRRAKSFLTIEKLQKF
jgi:hypothetical protein